MPKIKKQGKKSGSYNYREMYLYFLEPNDDGTIKTYDQVAEKYGTTPNYVYEISKKRNWVETREKHYDAQQKKAIQKYADSQDTLVSEMKDFWYETFSLLKDHIRVHKKEMADYKVGKRKTVVAGYNLEKLVEASVKTNNVLRVWMGMPSDISKSDVTNTTKVAIIDKEEFENIDNYLQKINGKQDNIQQESTANQGNS